MKRNSVFALILTLLLAIGTLPLKVPAAEGGGRSLEDPSSRRK